MPVTFPSFFMHTYEFSIAETYTEMLILILVLWHNGTGIGIMSLSRITD